MRLFSRLPLSLPLSLWRGKWFWGAWLLIFLLPWTRDEARLHFVGSRFSRRLYDQPWQPFWMKNSARPTASMSPLEGAIWRVWTKNASSSSYYSDFNPSYNTQGDPAQTFAGRLGKRFPKEAWLLAASVRDAIGYDGRVDKAKIMAAAKRGEQLDPKNALFPLVIARARFLQGKPEKGDAALTRAANCAYFDDGHGQLKATWLRAARKGGISTWSEISGLWWSDEAYAETTFLQNFAAQLAQRSQKEVLRGKTRSMLKRSANMIRVGMLLQREPCPLPLWTQGANWTQSAWTVSFPAFPKQPFRPGTLARFDALARRNNHPDIANLAQSGAKRVRLLAPYTTTPRWTPNNRHAPVLTPFESFWTEAGHASGFVILAFGAFFIAWWLVVSAVLWRAKGHESKSLARAIPAVVVVLFSVAIALGVMYQIFLWINNPAMARRGPPMGKLFVFVFWSALAFFAPPMLLALWCALVTKWKNREVLAMPARQQIEMNLSAFESWTLAHATGAFGAAFIALSLVLAGLWNYLNWNARGGQDWLRWAFPDISTRTIDPLFTSFDSFVPLLYASVCLAAVTLVWLFAWRYAVEPARRAVFHDGLRLWKETLGCAFTATSWVYFVFVLICHVSGAQLGKKLETAALRGEGAFVPGFNVGTK